MDGFNDNKNILVMAATNRAEILDPALLRPGRFDRKINFNLPNRLERKDILSMYYNKYKICENVEKSDIIEKLSYNTFGNNVMIYKIYLMNLLLLQLEIIKIVSMKRV